MRRRLTVILLLLVVVPLCALTLLGLRLASHQRQLVREQTEGLMRQRLDDADAAIARVVEERQRELRQLVDRLLADPAAARGLARELPGVRQPFVRGADGTMLHPTLESPSEAETQFLLRTRDLWARDDPFAPPARDASEQPTALAGAGEGWHTAFWDQGLHLLYWRRHDDGRIAGAELSRERLLADLIGVLPDTDPHDPSEELQRTQLVDAQGAVIYQWGLFEPAEDELPLTQRALRAPLGAWSLRCFVSPDAFAATARNAALGWIAGLAALGLALAGLGLYFYRESDREIREGMQRVGFVNRVSHELKTPLTNIRMYAELLQRDVDPDDERAQRHLDIVVSESQRLSRLIGNVLTFSRQQRDALTLHATPGVVDEAVQDVLEQFALSLQQKGIEVTFTRGAPATVPFDRDLVTQVVANLVSNVEKYAAGGGRLVIETAQTADRTTVTVRDRGPGIPAAAAERVFQPFERLGDAVTEGVSGAGIGLSLARDLARRHGGDLTLIPGAEGASFQLWFPHGTGEEDR